MKIMMNSFPMLIQLQRKPNRRLSPQLKRVEMKMISNDTYNGLIHLFWTKTLLLAWFFVLSLIKLYILYYRIVNSTTTKKRRTCLKIYSLKKVHTHTYPLRTFIIKKPNALTKDLLPSKHSLSGKTHPQSTHTHNNIPKRSKFILLN